MVMTHRSALTSWSKRRGVTDDPRMPTARLLADALDKLGGGDSTRLATLAREHRATVAAIEEARATMGLSPQQAMAAYAADEQGWSTPDAPRPEPPRTARHDT